MLSHSDPQSQALDRQAIAAADLRLDAQKGRQLMRELDAKWFCEGQTMFHDGQPISECWSPAHQRGWRYAQGLITESPILVVNWPTRPTIPVAFGGVRCPHCGSKATRKTAQGYRECSNCGGIF